MPLTKTTSPGRLLAAGEHRADHHRVGAGDECLGDLAGVLHAAVGDQRDARGLGGERRLVDRGHLRHADAGDDAGGADRARPDADLDGVGAGVDERLRALAGRDVAADDLDVLGRRVGLEPPDHVEQEVDVAVRGVGDEDVDPGLDQGGGPLPGVPEVADGRADEQPAVGVVRRVGELLALDEVLDGDESAEAALAVDERQPLALVGPQQRGRLLAGDADGAGDQALARHHLGDLGGRPLRDRREAQVAVGDDAEQVVVDVDDRAGRRRGTRRRGGRAPPASRRARSSRGWR